MYHSWPHNWFDVGQWRCNAPSPAFNSRPVQVIGKRIGECAGLHSERWMDKHPGWLDHNDHLLVFVNNLERDRLGRHRCGSAFIKGHIDRVSSDKLVTGSCKVSIYVTRACFNQASDPHSTQASKARRKELIKAAAFVRFFDHKLK